MVQAFQRILNIVVFFFPLSFCISILSPFFLFLRLCFHTISAGSLSLIYIYVLHIEKFFCVQSEAVRSSSLQLLINYRELKQLELLRYTINEHTLHDATQRHAGSAITRLQCKYLSLLISRTVFLSFSPCALRHIPANRDARAHTHRRVGGQLFQFIR